MRQESGRYLHLFSGLVHPTRANPALARPGSALPWLAGAAVLIGFAACSDGESSSPSDPGDGAESQIDTASPSGDVHDSLPGADTNPVQDSSTPETDSPSGGEACEPACDGKQCGSDGCGWVCGTCNAGEKCSESGICEKICVSKASKRCVQSDVWWVNSCDELESVAQTCPTGQTCEAGGCVPCKPKANKGCHDGNVVWFDGCGTPAEVIEICTGDKECLVGQCAPSPAVLVGMWDLALAPIQAQVLVEGVPVATLADWSKMDLQVASGGAVQSALQDGGGPSLELAGSFDGTKLSLSAVVQENVGESLLIRRFVVTALLQPGEGPKAFAGTMRELLFLDDELDPPTIVDRDFTATKF